MNRIGAIRVESRSDREQSAPFGSDRVRFHIRPRLRLRFPRPPIPTLGARMFVIRG
jgi:hypothetical protein